MPESVVGRPVVFFIVGRESRRNLAMKILARKRRMAILTGLVGAMAPPAGAAAQVIPFSQRGLVGQRVGFTDISIDYSRPVARGRVLFPGVVRWDTIWHPGADSASRMAVTRDIEVEGHPLPPGEYSFWLIPRESGRWTVILSRAARVFHTPYPGASQDALRFEVATEQGAHLETLGYYFPVVNRDEALLRIHWGTTIVPIRIRAPWRPGDAGTGP